SRRARRFRRGARDPHPHPPADADQFRRGEPDPGEGGDGRDGPARRGVPPADGLAEARVEAEDREGAERSRVAEDRARVGCGFRRAGTQPTMPLDTDITRLAAAGAAANRDDVRAAFARLREALSSGAVRAAEPDPHAPLGWRVNTWVKQGILLGFKYGDTVDASMDHGRWPFYDKDTLPLKKLPATAGVPIVP